MQNILEDSIAEDYYQISIDVLLSFPKFRPSVDLFVYNEAISQLYPFSRKGNRLTKEQADEITAHCKAGHLFVARSDHSIYVEHLANQADFILLDPNLREDEKALILLKAFKIRLQNLINQPLVTTYQPLAKDLAVFAEYIWSEPNRIEDFLPYLHTGEFDTVKHGINCLIIGSWLYIKNGNTKRRSFERVIEALILHDIGFIRVPAFVVHKKSPLTREEKGKFEAHVKYGASLVQKFGIVSDEIHGILVEHHENMDCSGYPYGLGSGMSEWGLLGSVVDAFCIMLTDMTKQYPQNLITTPQAMLTSGKYARNYCELLCDGVTSGLLKTKAKL